MSDKPLTVLHKAARDYASRGIPIFPCIANGKHPACQHGFKEATTDLRQIDAWWNENPNYNIGLEPERMGWAVVDVDTRSGLDPAAFPPTYTVATPSGGWHLYYYGSIAASVGKVALGVDTRGRNSYVLVPPSQIDGVEYRETDGVKITQPYSG